MNKHKLIRRMNRPLRDFLAALAMFAAVALSGIVVTPSAGPGAGTSWIASSAHARLLPADAVDPALEPFLVQPMSFQAPSAGQQQTLALLSLALAFSLIVALNLWFARHLRRVHATYRRRR